MLPSASPDTSPTAVATARFSVPAEDVWAYRLDFGNLPEYNPDVSDVRMVAEGEPDDAGGIRGPGARYAFRLADPRRPGSGHPVELWTVEAERSVLVAAGMSGGTDAYEEFVVRPLDGGGCEATLTLWVDLPDSLPPDVRAAAARGSLEQIEKELRLMKQVLEGSAAPPH